MAEQEVAADPPHVLPLSKRQRLLALLGLALLLALFGYLLSEATDPHSGVRKLLAGLLERVRDPKLGLLYVLLAFGVGTMLFVPVTVLLGATALALGPLLGFVYGMLGGLFGCAVSYWAGRAVGGSMLLRLGGPRLIKLRSHMHARSFRSVLIARFLPVGNFTMINLFLGSLKVPFMPYMLANVLGITPGLLAFTLLADQVQEAIRAPSLMSVGRLVLLALALLVAGFGFSRFMRSKAAGAS